MNGLKWCKWYCTIRKTLEFWCAITYETRAGEQNHPGCRCTRCDPLLFLQSVRGQPDSVKSRGREREQYPPCFQEKIRLIWRSLKERQPLLLRRGASKQVQGERLRLQRCAVGTLPLSLVLFINLFHPWRASSDPHSSQREAIAFLSLLIPLHHTYCAYLSPAQEYKGQRTTGRRLVFHSQSKSKGKGSV